MTTKAVEALPWITDNVMRLSSIGKPLRPGTGGCGRSGSASSLRPAVDWRHYPTDPLPTEPPYVVLADPEGNRFCVSGRREPPRR